MITQLQEQINDLNLDYHFEKDRQTRKIIIKERRTLLNKIEELEN